MNNAPFLHRFAETASDRPGYRRYVGAAKNCTITGTLLGVYDEENVPREATGAIWLGHTNFFFAKDFKFTMKPGLSVFYAPTELMLPDELLKETPSESGSRRS